MWEADAKHLCICLTLVYRQSLPSSGRSFGLKGKRVFVRFLAQNKIDMPNPFNLKQLSDKEKKALQVKTQRFQKKNDEEQKDMIKKARNKDKELADFLEKVRRVQKRSGKIDQLADKIIDRVS